MKGVAGTGGQSNEVVVSPEYDTNQLPAKISLSRRDNEPHNESYMSYTEPGSESEETTQNCELNSNVSVTQFPNHGYTSGYATGTNNK